jgi:hypothetical protein
MAESTATQVLVDNDTHTLTVEVTHTNSASYRRSVTPCANKAFDKFMRSPEGKAWISAGYYRFSVKSDYSIREGVSVITYSVTEG